MVRFVHGRRLVAEQDMDTVPRNGKGVVFSGSTSFVVWNVAWDLQGPQAPAAVVGLKTEAERDRLIR